jgi:TPM domain
VAALAAAPAFALFLPAFAAAQGSDTIFDDADALSDSGEQNVQQAFDAAQEEAGQPLYAFLTPETGVEDQQARQELLNQRASEEGLPQEAGVIVVAPDDGWVQSANLDGVSEQEVYETMRPDFEERDFAAGLVAGAEEIAGEPVAAQDGSDPGTGGLPGSWPLLLLVAAVGALLWFRNRRSNRRRAEEERATAEEEFAELTTRLDEFDGKERLVSGYLEAQRPLLDQRTEEWVEAKISDAKTAGFAREFNEASSQPALCWPAVAASSKTPSRSSTRPRRP